MDTIELPEPDPDGQLSVERAIATRASRRTFASDPVTLEDVSQLLWAAQGITHVRSGVRMRAAPSAGATYPLETVLEVAPDGCEALEASLYRYEQATHRLEQIHAEPCHDELTAAALTQEVVRDAPATIALAANVDRTRRQYPAHADRYVHMEAGHVAENVHLVCASRELNTCPVGAFSDDEVRDVLELSDDLEPLYLLPFGNRPPIQSGNE